MELLGSQLRKIQQVAEYRLAIRPMGTPGLGNVLFGALVVIGAIIDIERPGFTAIQIVIGVLQLAIGFSQSRKRSLKGLLLNGCIQIVIGIWSIAAFLYARQQHGDTIFLHWVIIGIVMTGYGITNLHKYRKFLRIFPQPPPEEDLRLVRDLIDKVSRSSPHASPDVIVLKMSARFGLHSKWKGLLLDNAAIFVTGKYFLMCDRKENITIMDNVSIVLFGPRDINLRIGGRNYQAYITRKYLDRYWAWKS